MILWWLVACSRLPGAPVGPAEGGPPPEGISCPVGTTWRAEAGERWWEGTEVHGCSDGQRPDGPHLERWPGGGVATEGAWSAGLRDGPWTHWRPDGAFHSRVDWRQGRPEGDRIEVGRDGRLVRIRMVDGAAVGFEVLPAGTPMPEWEGDRRVEGARYAEPAPGG